MSDLHRVLLCFSRPKPGQYVGGLVTLCNDYTDRAPLFRDNGVEIGTFNYNLPEKGIVSKIKSSKVRNILDCFGQIKALRKVLRKDGNVTLHIHTSRKALFIKCVLLASAVRKLCKGKIVMTIHVGDIKTVFHNNTTEKILIKMMNRSIDKTIFLSDRMRHQFIDAGLKEDRTALLYNFYNIKSCTPDKKIKNSAPRILFLGSINREKGIIELLESLCEIDKDFHADICGTFLEHDTRLRFEALMQKLGDKATYHGYVDKDTKEALLQKTDILALPSYREGLPISILEAMANSCAIVTTPVGAIPEILTERNAEIIPSRDKEALRHSIDKLLSDPTLMDQMKAINYTESSKFADVEHINKLCKIYQ